MEWCENNSQLQVYVPFPNKHMDIEHCPLSILLAVTCTDRGGVKDGSVSPSKGPYLPGDEVTYSCETGFKLIGEKTDICQNSGNWKEEKKPFCLAGLRQ